MINNIQSTFLSILFLLIVQTLPKVVLSQELKSLENSKNRVVLNKVLPTSPSNMDRTVKIPLSFTVLPDGTVGEVIPLSKGDPSLEASSIKTLKKWKFNPIEDNVIMKGEITFTFSPDGRGYYTSKENQITPSDKKSKNTKTGNYYPVNFTNWGEFMNRYAVWVDNKDNSNQGNTTELAFSFSLLEDKIYDIEMAADDIATVIFDGVEVSKVSNYVGKEMFKLFLSKGKHICSVRLLNYASSTSKWQDNPSGFAMVISDNGKTIITTRNLNNVEKKSTKYYPVSHPVWNDLLKNHAVWINNKENNHEGEYKDLTFETIISKSGFYNFEISADDTAEFILDGNKIMDISYQKGIHNLKIKLEEGVHQLQMKVMNFTLYKSNWEENGVGAAILVKDNSGNIVFSTRDEKYCYKEMSADKNISKFNSQSHLNIPKKTKNDSKPDVIHQVNIMKIINTPIDNIFYPDKYARRTNIRLTQWGEKYVYSPEVKNGKQEWMTRNLEVDRFRNGDIIPEVKSNEEWEEYAKLKKPAWCYYMNNPAYGKIYGKLYNGFAFIDPRGLAPSGYRLPTIDDFRDLVNKYEKYEISSGGNAIMGNIIENCQRALSSTTGWKKIKKETKNISNLRGGRISIYEYVSLNGNNKSKFNALPSGYRTPSGKFDGLGISTTFFGAPINCEHTHYYIPIGKFTKEQYPNCPVNCEDSNSICLSSLRLGWCNNGAEEKGSSLGVGSSVRCIKD